MSLLYESKEFTIKGTNVYKLYMSTQLSHNNYAPYLEFTCDKGGFKMSRTTTPQRGVFVTAPYVTDQYVYIPKMICDAYDFNLRAKVSVKVLDDGDIRVNVPCRGSLPHPSMIQSPPIFAGSINEKSMSIRKLGNGNRLNINGKSGVVRVDVYSSTCNMIVIRSYDPRRDEGIEDYSYLHDNYGIGLSNFPYGDFSYTTKIIGNTGFYFYKKLISLFDITPSVTKFKVYKGSGKSIVIVPERECDICHNPINTLIEAPEKLYFEEDVANDNEFLMKAVAMVNEMNEKMAVFANAQQVLLKELNKVKKENKTLRKALVGSQDLGQKEAHQSDETVLSMPFSERKPNADAQNKRSAIVVKSRKKNKTSKAKTGSAFKAIDEKVKDFSQFIDIDLESFEIPSDFFSSDF